MPAQSQHDARAISRRAFDALPIERIAWIRDFNAQDAKTILKQLARSPTDIYQALDVSRATVARRARRGETLSMQDAERILGVAKLIGQVEKMVESAANADSFEAASWLSTWLGQPLPAFDGRPPAEFLDTMEGQAMLSLVLSRIEWVKGLRRSPPLPARHDLVQQFVPPLQRAPLLRQV